MSVSVLRWGFSIHSSHGHWSLCTCIKGISSTLCSPPPPCHASSLSCHYQCCMCILSVSFGLVCMGDEGAGRSYRWMRGFLWWCSVGERRRAASWHERGGGGDDELDINKLSLQTQQSTHCNKQKEKRQTSDKPGVTNNNQTSVHSVSPTEERCKPQVRLGQVKWK